MVVKLSVKGMDGLRVQNSDHPDSFVEDTFPDNDISCMNRLYF